MRYTLAITIDAPLATVVACFDNADNLSQWQTGFLRMTHVSGVRGKAGAKSKLIYKRGSKDFEIIETIVTRHPPQEFTFIYEAQGVWNYMQNKFSVIDEQHTKWFTENTFKCKGFIALLAFFLPRMFKKQTLKDMRAFKKFVETR